MALRKANISVELREIVLSQKPDDMLAISPKGTVPVLLLPEGRVIEESYEIMRWALALNDPDGWLGIDMGKAEALIHKNDFEFKAHLDAYKYIDRFPGKNRDEEKEAAEIFLSELDDLLALSTCLAGHHMSLVDAAIAPFIRQFSGVEPQWFASSKYQRVIRWLGEFTGSRLFESVMGKYPRWAPGDPVTLFGAD
ncbi:MAG: glutathione S-transferase [Gammaproteobacteria bacterium]|nr:glutathione S-transferase [Gammaproteobacteria bacterium]